MDNKEKNEITNDEIEALLACEICDKICFRGIVLSCCGSQACRACALKKVTAVRNRWSCQKPAKSADFQNDNDLRLAVSKFKGDTEHKFDQKTIAAIKARRKLYLNKTTIIHEETVLKKYEKIQLKEAGNSQQNKPQTSKKNLINSQEIFVKIPPNLNDQNQPMKVNKNNCFDEKVIKTVDRSPLVCFKIPQVMQVVARTVTGDIAGIRYQINEQGFTGQGVVKLENRRASISSVGCLVKFMPERFSKNTFDPHQLATNSGVYPDIKKNTILGDFVGLTEPEFKEVSPASPQVPQFKLVFKGPASFKVDGFKCLTAQFADKDGAKNILLGSPDHFYRVDCEHEGLYIFTTVVSPFPEDDNCVRVVVIPTSKLGLELKNGEVLGSVKLLPAGLCFTNNMVKNNGLINQLWTSEGVAKFLTLEMVNDLTNDYKTRMIKTEHKGTRKNLERTVLYEEATRLKIQGDTEMNGESIEKVIKDNVPKSKAEKKLRKNLQERAELHQEAIKLKSEGATEMHGKPIEEVILNTKPVSEEEEQLRKSIQKRADLHEEAKRLLVKGVTEMHGQPIEDVIMNSRPSYSKEQNMLQKKSIMNQIQCLKAGRQINDNKTNEIKKSIDEKIDVEYKKEIKESNDQNQPKGKKDKNKMSQKSLRKRIQFLQEKIKNPGDGSEEEKAKNLKELVMLNFKVKGQVKNKDDNKSNGNKFKKLGELGAQKYRVKNNLSDQQQQQGSSRPNQASGSSGIQTVSKRSNPEQNQVTNKRNCLNKSAPNQRKSWNNSAHNQRGSMSHQADNHSSSWINTPDNQRNSWNNSTDNQRSSWINSAESERNNWNSYEQTPTDYNESFRQSVFDQGRFGQQNSLGNSYSYEEQRIALEREKMAILQSKMELEALKRMREDMHHQGSRM